MRNPIKQITHNHKRKIRSGFISKEIKQAAKGQIGTRQLGKSRPNRTPGHHLLPRSQKTALNEFKISSLIRKNKSFSAHESKPEGRRRTHGAFIKGNRQASDQWVVGQKIVSTVKRWDRLGARSAGAELSEVNRVRGFKERALG
jgi:hypothetical protein